MENNLSKENISKLHTETNESAIIKLLKDIKKELHNISQIMESNKEYVDIMKANYLWNIDNNQLLRQSKKIKFSDIYEKALGRLNNL